MRTICGALSRLIDELFVQVCLFVGSESAADDFSCFQIGGRNISVPPLFGNRFQIPSIFIGLPVATMRFPFHFRCKLHAKNGPEIYACCYSVATLPDRLQ
jgi:hypothetical protein